MSVLTVYLYVVCICSCLSAVVLVFFIYKFKSSKIICENINMPSSFFRSLAATGQPSNDLYSPTAQAHIYTSPTLLPLTKKQRRLVTNNPGTIVAIAKGARMAVDECQYQFKDRRWNCSVEAGDHGGSVFGKIIEKGKSFLRHMC